MSIIAVENDGPIITNTNYWESEHATAGYAYLTINAGWKGRFATYTSDIADVPSAQAIGMLGARYGLSERSLRRILKG